MTICKDANQQWLIDGVPGDPRFFDIYFGREKIRFVQAVNDVEGWVDVLVMAEKNGQPVALMGRDGKPMVKRLKGSVRIVDRRGLPVGPLKPQPLRA